jgi:hypothetical protein
VSGGEAPLTVWLPGDLLEQLEEAARDELRTTEAQAQWLIRTGLHSREARITAARTNQDRLRDAEELRGLLAKAVLETGKPSHREIARLAEDRGYSISHTTVSEIMRGAHFPSWRLVEAIAFALNLTPGRFRKAWEKAAQ